ncbi:MAG TPA: TonB-dependent receptor, partial [Anseongella sp.]
LYLYNQLYLRVNGYSFGETAANENPNVIGIFEGDLGNDNVTWEKKRSADIGLDLNMFRDRLSLTVDYFSEVRYDQLVFRGSVPTILGIGFSPTNVAKVQNRGWDGQISYRNNWGQVQYNVTGVFSFAKNKILFQDEAIPRYPWLARTGHSIGQSFGYTWIGFYEDEADVAESAKPEIAGIRPGDLKYKDLNGDGIINENDMGPIGKPNLPNTTAGLTLGMGYKGFSLSVLFQGSTGYSFRVVGVGIEPFIGQLQPIHRERWTPSTSESARFPRLSTNPSGINSSGSFPSNFWLLNVQYLRLKTVEMGYQLPSRWLPLSISNARLYLSAYNLLTWTNYDFYQQDPEVTSGSVGDAYLNQRVINLGLQIGF